MKKYKGFIALLMALSILFSFSAFAADGVKGNEPVEEFVLSEDELKAIYDPSNYEDEFELGVVVVGLKHFYPEEQDFEEILPEISVQDIYRIPFKTRTILKITLTEESREAVIDAIGLLKENPIVTYAKPNYFDSFELYYSFTDIDPYYDDYQWNLDFIDAPDAWDITTGNSSDPVSVAVVDTGIYEHEDLIDNLDLYSEGWDCVHAISGGTLDDNGHGTHIAGIIGAKGDNGTGIAGICWNVNLVPFKNSNANQSLESRTDDLHFVDGVLLAEFFEIPIMNFSQGTTRVIPELETAFLDYSGLAVVAAGNSCEDLDNPTTPIYPIAYVSELDNMIVVGNTSEYGACSDSNYGDVVDLMAPGYLIYSTVPWSGDYDYMSGTSMSAAHVTGVAALVLSYHPTYTIAQLKESIIESVVTDNNYNGWCWTSGVVNAKNALEYMAFTVGDINNDGLINDTDRNMISNYLVNLITLTDDEFYCADINGDGVVNNIDLILILSLYT